MTRWPPMQFTTHAWEHRDPFASRRSQARNKGKFQAATPPYIATLPVTLSPETAAAAAETTSTMTRFDHEFSQLGHVSFAAVLLRGESATSSQIENLTVNARKLSLAAIGAPVGGNAELVARNVSAMQAAINLAQQLDVSAILQMHQELTQGIQHDAGKFREEWVWIGGESPVTANFVAPAWQDIPALMDDLTQFINRRDLDPTVQAAIAHAQFETIHPFTDGNGRTGRALISALLRARGVTQNVTVPISSGLLHDIDGYIQALTAYRTGDLEPLLMCFATAVRGALSNARLLGEDLEKVRESALSSRSRITVALREVARFIYTEPAFTAEMLEHHTSASKATVYRVIDSLVEAGLLRTERKVRGQQVWTCPPALAALDSFALRAGRRRFS